MVKVASECFQVLMGNLYASKHKPAFVRLSSCFLQIFLDSRKLLSIGPITAKQPTIQNEYKYVLMLLSATRRDQMIRFNKTCGRAAMLKILEWFPHGVLSFECDPTRSENTFVSRAASSVMPSLRNTAARSQ